MPIRTFQSKLIALLVAALVLLEAAMLVAVYVAGNRTLGRIVSEELAVGTRVLDHILTTRARRLADSSRVLARDFPFREAIASSDVLTIASVLANSGERIEADVMFAIALDGTVMAEPAMGNLVGRPFPFPQLIARAEMDGESSATVSFQDRPFQMVVVPVLAPRTIAWVCAGFEIDEDVIVDVRKLTGLEVALWSVSSRATPQLISTLDDAKRDDLLRQIGPVTQDRKSTEQAFALGGTEFATLLQPVPTADRSRVSALLQRDLDSARRDFVDDLRYIFGISALILIAVVITGVAFSRSVTRPLRTLAEAAGRIERGNYVTPVSLRQKDEVGQLATVFNTMQSAIAAREIQITHQATHDALTGLPNRTLFRSRLSGALSAAAGEGRPIGILVMDVDRFKEINDTLGHDFGDQLLIEIGRRLVQTLDASDTVARLGGDEFAVHFAAADETRATDVARRVGTAFEAPFMLGEVSIEVAASIGIAMYPLHAGDADTLMKRAEVAMYDAKKNLSRIAFYEAGRDEHSLRRLTLMMELRQAIARNELELYFQPKIDVATRRVVHAEALVRWRHAKHGVMSPDEFVPLAEQSGNVGLLTKWVLRNAIEHCAAWSRDGLPITVAVNLSALDLFDSELPTFVSGLIAEAGVPAERLVLEITESAVMRDAAHALRILRELKRRGVRLAIDDFGTGYSSLAHLKRLPVDELKIDKSFVLQLSEQASDDLVIVRSTIELGHNMGLKVVAEGVESDEALRILERFGCDMAQGYFMSRPLDDTAFRSWLATSEWGRRAEPATTSDPQSPLVSS
ncbi:MAG: EAL domain-containing protein [Thermoanaerobaculia bacterium]